MQCFAQGELRLDAFLQYGSFGLLALLVVWVIWRGIPYFLETHRAVIETMAVKHEEAVTRISEAHKTAVNAMLLSFEREAEQCRQERITEGEKERVSRAALSDKFERLVQTFEGRGQS